MHVWIKKNLANANTSFGQKQLSFVIETKRILIFFITLEYVYKYVWHGMELCKSCIGNTALGVLLLQFYSSVHFFLNVSFRNKFTLSGTDISADRKDSSVMGGSLGGWRCSWTLANLRILKKMQIWEIHK